MTKKFRVWDTKNKEFIYNPMDKLFLDFQGNPVSIEVPTMQIVRFRDRFVVQRFTGHKDKNGKEICEGDIIQALVYCEGEKRNFEVCFGNVNEILLNPGEEADALLSGFYLKGVKELGQIGELKVIGNIFESLELLKT